MTLESIVAFLDVNLIDDSPEIRADVIRAVRAVMHFKAECDNYAKILGRCGSKLVPPIPDHPDTYSNPVEIDPP